MKWYGILSLVFILFVLAGIVYVGANPGKLSVDFGKPSQISKEMTSYDDEKTSPAQSQKSNAECNYWYSQWELAKAQRDFHDPQSAKYLQFELEMKEKMDKFKACYGQ